MQSDDQRAVVEGGEPEVNLAQRDQLDVDDEVGECCEDRRWEVLVEREANGPTRRHQAAATNVPRDRSNSIASARLSWVSSG